MANKSQIVFKEKLEATKGAYDSFQTSKLWVITQYLVNWILTFPLLENLTCQRTVEHLFNKGHSSVRTLPQFRLFRNIVIPAQTKVQEKFRSDDNQDLLLRKCLSMNVVTYKVR